MIAYLALEGKEAPRRDLARLLFPGAEEPMAVLRWHLSYLRSRAPSFITRHLRATRQGVVLSVPTDVVLFHRGAQTICQRPETPGAARTLALYRDDLVASLAVSASAEFDNRLYVLQERARRDFRRATLAFAAGRSSTRPSGRPSSLRLVTVDPYCEDGHVLLIQAYDALKDTARAAAAYDRYQRIVRRELAAEPRPPLASRFEGRSSAGPRLPPEDFVSLKDVILHIVDWAGGEPSVLAIHGSAGIAHNFAALAERLAPTYRFIGVDLRGHGFSDKPPTGYDLERHVEDLGQLIRTLNLRRPVLLGHSAGGAVATFVAAHTDVAGLIRLEGMIGDRAFAENAAAQSAPLATRLGLPAAGFDAYLSKWRASRNRYSDDAERLIDRWARFALAPRPGGGYLERALRTAVEAEWGSIIAANTLAALGRVRCPVMIVQALKPWIGGRPYFSPRIVDAQRAVAPHAVLFVAEHLDHATIIRDPEPGMVAALATFLSKCTGAQAVTTP